MTSRLFVLSLSILAIASGCKRPVASQSESAPATDPAWFEDVTRKLGLEFTHDCGPIEPDCFMPQIMGSGCAFLDFDGDGRLDIYLIHNGGPKGAKNQLFHQEADGTYRDVSAGSGLDVAGYGMGVAVGDFDNDGLPDLVLTEFGATRLFHNEGGGHFREITKEAGLDNPLWATSAAFFDFDRDGWLDLIVVNYVDYDRSMTCGSRGGKLDYCGPRTFPGTTARLYRNRGSQPGPRFEDVTLKAGLSSLKGKGLGVLCADFDGDGWPDIFSANDSMANHLWINQHNGTFKEEAITRGVAYTGSAGVAANMGVAWADFDGDGLPDLFVTHLVEETHTLWKQEKRGFYQDRTAATGLLASERSTGFGVAAVDFDRDGWPDLVFVNGSVVRNHGAGDGPHWSQYSQRHQLFANSGEGKFRDISRTTPDLCGQPGMGRGLAVGDFDNDGAIDLLVTEVGGPARLYRNIAPAHGHWLSIRALLPAQKRDAYGAEITVRAGGKSYFRLVNPASSFCCSNDPRAFLGLGSADRYDAIDVHWPDGQKESFASGMADRHVILRQGEGKKLP